MAERIDTVVVGAGQAGLSVSYYLTQQGREHIILEQAPHIVSAWQKRWDSFTLVLPNWTFVLPEGKQASPDPDGFMSKAELVERFEKFAAEFNPEIRFNTTAQSLERDGDTYLIQTSDGAFEAENVVVATGSFQNANIPEISKALPKGIMQTHTDGYRNPEQLPEGAVLVVGTGQSGSQIAEELYQSGRKVYLCVGGANRVPRLYRGKDSIWWLTQTGFFDVPAASLEDSKMRFKANPYVSGKNGGHELNPYKFAHDGVTLLGRLKKVEGNTITLEGDLKQTLKNVDEFYAGIKKQIDEYIESEGLDAPEEPEGPEYRDGYEVEEIPELDLAEANINSVVWATGYRFDYNWVKLPVLDGDGYPAQERGVTESPGLYFVGMHFLHRRASGTLLGMAADAEHVVNHLVNRQA